MVMKSVKLASILFYLNSFLIYIYNSKHIIILYIAHVNYFKNFNINNYIANAVHLLNNKQVSFLFYPV